MSRKSESRSDVMAATFLVVAVFLFFGEALRPGSEILYGYDVDRLFAPLLRFSFTAWQDGRFPLWNPHLFLGFPQYAEPQLSTFYPLMWLFSPFSFSAALSWLYALHFALSAVGGYIFARQVGARWTGGLVTGLVLGFNAFMVSRLAAGHFPHLMTIAYLPWVLVGIQWAAGARTSFAVIFRTMVSAIPLGLAFLAGYAPFFPFLVIAITVWAWGLAWMRWRSGDRRGTAVLLLQWAAMGAFAGLLAAVQLLPTAEMTLLSSRAAGTDYSFVNSFFMPFEHLLTLLTPDIFGAPNSPVSAWPGVSFVRYWENGIYIGIFPLLLFFLVWRQEKWSWRFWAGMALVGIILAFGAEGGFHRAFYHLIPGFRLFRVPGRFGFFFVFIVAVLAGLMWDRWLSLPPAQVRGQRRQMNKILGGGLLIILCFLFLSLLWRTFPEQVVDAERLGAVTSQLMRLAVLFAGGMLLLGWGHGRPRWQAGTAAVLLLLFDLWGFGNKLIDLRPSAPPLGWVMADLALPADRENYRVHSHGLFTNAGLQFGFQHLSGYDDFRTETGSQLERLARTDERFLRLLGVRYLLVGTGEEMNVNLSGWELVTEPAGVRIYERANSLAKAFVVHEVIPAVDAADALRRLESDPLDWSRQAVVEVVPQTSCAVEPGDPAAAVVTLTSYEAERIILQTTTAANGWLVLNDLHYPGWRAYVSGREAVIQPTNYGLRGICLPAGEHEVQFRFEPQIFILGRGVSMAAWGLLLAMGIVRLGMGLWRR
jgi:hypothetical protein